MNQFPRSAPITVAVLGAPTLSATGSEKSPFAVSPAPKNTSAANSPEAIRAFWGRVHGESH